MISVKSLNGKVLRFDVEPFSINLLSIPERIPRVHSDTKIAFVEAFPIIHWDGR